MKNNTPKHFPLTPAGRVGLSALLISVPVFFLDARLAVIPLAGFILLCLGAPFFPRFSFYLPVISHGTSGKQAVALTFDDGPDPVTTPKLLALLSRYRVKAVFFVIGEKAAAHPELIGDILSQGHAVGNHTYSHDPLILLRSSKRLFEEIKATQDVLRHFEIVSFVFRPPAGMTNPRLGKVLQQLGLSLVNFSCRAFDRDNRWIRGLSRKILKKIQPDDIVLLHDVPPRKTELLDDWLEEIEQILAGLDAKGLKVLPLSEIIGRTVMTAREENPAEGTETESPPSEREATRCTVEGGSGPKPFLK